jgi:ATP-dependent DNA helicase RecQ
LKRWRHKTSAALGIPAYRVLTNATIDRIAESCPTTTEQLGAISGIGPATIEQFGYDIVELIRETIGIDDQEADQTGAEPAIRETTAIRREQVAEVDAPEDAFPADAASELPAVHSASDQSDAYWTWRLFRDGYSASQIAAIRRCEVSSLVDDLILAASAGHLVDPSWITASDDAKRIRDALEGAAIGG